MKILPLIPALLGALASLCLTAEARDPKPAKETPSSPHLPKDAKHLKNLLRELTKKGTVPPTSSGVARGDYNGDGFADLAVGIPGEDAGSISAAGAVIVIYGSANGLVSENTTALRVPAPQFWSQASTGISGGDESGDRFGTALAAGEFNGDAFSDLAIGVPGEDLSSGGTNIPNAGRVVIIYGSSAGLAASGTSIVRAAQSFDLVSGTAPTVITARISSEIFPENASLGQTLAWGDFNGDTIGDLAIGAPNMAVKDDSAFFKDTEAGQVWVLFGSVRNGIIRTGSQLVTQAGNLAFSGFGSPRGGWHNGAALTAGDFNGDGTSDLVLSAPDATVGGKSEVGLFTVFPGVAGVGLDWGRGRFIGSGTVGVTSQPGEHFGFSFAVGDFDRDGRSDLAIGAPNQRSDAGAVHILFGDATTLLDQESPQFCDQNSLFGSGREAGDRFGHSLAAGDFNGDTFADLAIGVPREDLAGTTDAGEINIVFGSGAGLTTTGSLPPQRLGDVNAQAGAQFGRSLSAWNFGRNQRIVLPLTGLILTLRAADLAVGVPLKDIAGQVDAGAIHIFYGTSAGLTFTGEQEWTQNSPGIPGGSEAGDLFGGAAY